MDRRIERLLAVHAAEIEAIGRELAQNFDAPAQRIINAGFERMCVARFTPAGDDLWEMVTCHQNGWTYERPARRLIDRWASY